MSILDGGQVRPTGDAGVVIEYGAEIDPAVHERVLAADRAVAAAALPGVEETVPSYRSLLLRLDPLVTTPAAVVAALVDVQPLPLDHAPTRLEVPVSFADVDAPDLSAVADRVGCTPSEVIALLTGGDLRVYLHGFAPGFAYLGGVPPELHLARRDTPRSPVPAGSVLLAGGQAALCPTSMPTGWWVVGRTDTPLFDPTADPPVPITPGDVVRLTVRAA